MRVRARSGAIAQLGERLLCKQEVVGSIPSGSTSRVCSFAEKQKPHRSDAARPKCACVLSDIVKRKDRSEIRS
jgi:hypothetical protein